MGSFKFERIRIIFSNDLSDSSQKMLEITKNLCENSKIILAYSQENLIILIRNGNCSEQLDLRDLEEDQNVKSVNVKILTDISISFLLNLIEAHYKENSKDFFLYRRVSLTDTNPPEYKHEWIVEKRNLNLKECEEILESYIQKTSLRI